MSLEDILCTRCGLCCDGTLLDDAELSGEAEADRLEILGIETEDDDVPVLPFPCAALAGTSCRIYRYRPGVCRTFECKLLQDTKAGILSLDQAKRRIRRARTQATQQHRLDARIRKFFLP
jgi:uncharacterized protein